MATLPIAVPGSLHDRSKATLPKLPPGVDVQQEATRTIWGIWLIGFGLGLSAVSMLFALAFGWPSALPLYPTGGASCAAIGFPLLMVYPGTFGRPHVWRVRVALALAVIAVVVGVSLWLLGPSRSDMNVTASSLRIQLLGGTLFVVLASIAVYLAIDRLSTPSMRRVAIGALAAAFVIQVVVYIVVNRAIAADLPLGLVGWDTLPLTDVQKTWSWWGGLNAIPLVLFLATYESAYRRLRRQYTPPFAATAA